MTDRTGYSSFVKCQRQLHDRGIATSRNGSFMLKNIKNGSYLLHVSFVGFDPSINPCVLTETIQVKLGKLALTDGGNSIGAEAVVIGKARK